MGKVIKLPTKPKKSEKQCPWSKILHENWPEEYDQVGDRKPENL